MEAASTQPMNPVEVRWYPDKYLRSCIQKQHACLDGLSTTRLLQGLMRMSSRKTGIRIGTGFTGTNISERVLTMLATHWAHLFGKSITFHHLFACDKSEDVQEFLKLEWSPAVIFADMADLKKQTAHCVVSGTEALISVRRFSPSLDHPLVSSVFAPHRSERQICLFFISHFVSASCGL